MDEAVAERRKAQGAPSEYELVPGEDAPHRRHRKGHDQEAQRPQPSEMDRLRDRPCAEGTGEGLPQQPGERQKGGDKRDGLFGADGAGAFAVDGIEEGGIEEGHAPIRQWGLSMVFAAALGQVTARLRTNA